MSTGKAGDTSFKELQFEKRGHHIVYPWLLVFQALEKYHT